MLMLFSVVVNGMMVNFNVISIEKMVDKMKFIIKIFEGYMEKFMSEMCMGN